MEDPTENDHTPGSEGVAPLVDRAEREIHCLETAVDDVFEIVGSVQDDEAAPSTDSIPVTVQESIDDPEAVRMGVDDFLDSLWRLRSELEPFRTTPGSADPLVLLTTHQMVLADWQHLHTLLGGADDDDDDGGSGGSTSTGTTSGSGSVLSNLINTLQNHLRKLSSVITNLLSTAGSLDSWELAGGLSGSLPGFSGTLELTMTFQ